MLICERMRLSVKALLACISCLIAAAIAPCPCQARVSTEMKCSVCHTMHNSQAGQPMAYEYSEGAFESTATPQTNLLVTDCVGCHTALDGSSSSGVGGAPVVFNTAEPSYGADAGDGNKAGLAGGNFYWVTQADGKGHNIFTADGVLSQAPGKSSGGGGGCSCHNSLVSEGCKGCHMRSDVLKKYHHADDSATVVDSAAEGWYRFLSGHHTHGEGHGVSGIEDDDRQLTQGSSDHNEYLGSAGSHNDDSGFRYVGNTMTGFCSGCHGTFHVQDTTSTGESPWIRHPSDTVIPNSGEYASYTTYNPLVPAARPSLSAVSPTVTPGTDLVFCLSCHRAHGSPYNNMLRWDYEGSDLSDSLAGCVVCHTSKS